MTQANDPGGVKLNREIAQLRGYTCRSVERTSGQIGYAIFAPEGQQLTKYLHFKECDAWWEAEEWEFVPHWVWQVDEAIKLCLEAEAIDNRRLVITQSYVQWGLTNGMCLGKESFDPSKSCSLAWALAKLAKDALEYDK